MQFSPSGKKLLTIGADEHNSIAVYDWANQQILCSVKGGLNKVYDASWYSDTEFMTADAKLVQFHKIAGKSIVSTKGALGKDRGKLQEHRSCCFAFEKNDMN